jgi:hypothetical protein
LSVEITRGYTFFSERPIGAELKIAFDTQLTDYELAQTCRDLGKLFRGQKNAILDGYGHCIVYYEPIVVIVRKRTIMQYKFISSAAVRRNGTVVVDDTLAEDNGLFWSALMADYCAVAASEYFAAEA